MSRALEGSGDGELLRRDTWPVTLLTTPLAALTGGGLEVASRQRRIT
jgi:hypothetical protein